MLAAVKSKLADYRRELEELKKYKDENESIIDNATEFIENPESFWNHAATPVKKIVQQFIASNGIPYDLENCIWNHARNSIVSVNKKNHPKG